MEHPRDEAPEAMLGDIIEHGSEAVLSFLNDTDGLEGEDEESDYGDRTMEEEGHDHDGPVTQCRRKKDTVMSAPLTEPSLARYIY